ncbi:transposase [Mesorhizobium sp. M1027]|uniref:transposase n=1 Tax=Mesorhizobium sp. M1027 TaxID=2957050 RepID=UPI00333D6CA9
MKPGANVSAIARQAGMAPAQLFDWRSKAMKSGAITPQRDGTVGNSVREAGFVIG